MWSDTLSQIGSWLVALQAHAMWVRYAGTVGLTLLLLVLTFHLGRQVRQHTRSLLRRLRCFDEALLPGLGSLAQYGVYFVGTGILLNLWGVNPTAILAVLGTIGLTIGLALRNTLSNIASGVLLLLLRPFSPGDLIESGSISGKVREINLFTTLLDTPDGVLVEVTNGVLWGPPIRNLSRRAHRRIEIPLAIPPTMSIDEAETHIRNTLAGDGRLCAPPLPTLVAVPKEENGTAYVVRMWVLPGVGDAEEVPLRKMVEGIHYGNHPRPLPEVEVPEHARGAAPSSCQPVENPSRSIQRMLADKSRNETGDETNTSSNDV